MRHWSLVRKVLADVAKLLYLGKRCVLKVLVWSILHLFYTIHTPLTKPPITNSTLPFSYGMQALLATRSVMEHTDTHYVLNKVFLDDYCVWVQGIDGAVRALYGKF